MKMSVIVKLQVEGLHSWKDCSLAEVEYLLALHRHVFYIECKASVSDTGREIEIIMLKRKIMNAVADNFYDKKFKCANFGNMSCEDIACWLITMFDLVSCTVLEDNENGAEVMK